MNAAGRDLVSVLVSVLVSFTPVRPGPAAAQQFAPSQVRTGANPSGQGSGELESVLGATPHEFESRILRSSEGPHRFGGAGPLSFGSHLQARRRAR